MSSTLNSTENASLSTLSLLETRLRRIEFLLTGSADVDGIPKPASSLGVPSSSKATIPGRLQQLQDDLSKLRKLPGPAGDLVRDVESLHIQVPEIFNDVTPSPLTSIADQAQYIFANAALYPETASRLSSLQTLTVPPAELSAQLVEMQPRIEALRLRQEKLDAQARDLRERSVRCLEWWVKFGVVGMGELWTDWEERVHDAEKTVGRLERLKTEKDEFV